MHLEPSGALIDAVNACEPNWVCPERLGRVMAESLDRSFRALGLVEQVDELWRGYSHQHWLTPEAAAEWSERAEDQLSTWLREHEVPELSLWLPSRVAQEWISVTWKPRST